MSRYLPCHGVSLHIEDRTEGCVGGMVVWWGFNFLYWKVFINSDDNSLSEDLGMEW